MNTFVFQPGMTWRKAGFALYSNSLRYRDILDDNPGWSVTELPPPGTVLKIKTTPRGTGSSQQPLIFGQSSPQSTLDYYPFDSKSEYFASLSKYSPSALLEIDRINGLTMDSRPAFTGLDQ